MAQPSRSQVRLRLAADYAAYYTTTGGGESQAIYAQISLRLPYDFPTVTIMGAG